MRSLSKCLISIIITQFAHTVDLQLLIMLDLMPCHPAEYIQELNMHQGLYSAVVRSLQHYDRLQSHSSATSSSQDRLTSQQVPEMSLFFLLGIFICSLCARAVGSNTLPGLLGATHYPYIGLLLQLLLCTDGVCCHELCPCYLPSYCNYASAANYSNGCLDCTIVLSDCLYSPATVHSHSS